MNQNEMIDVFISYRREGGATAARLLYEILKSKKITGFMDVETLTRGDYEASIISHIEKARNFILIVSADVMKSQWVKREVMYALELGKHVIPVFVNGVTCFPDDIPVEIKAVDVNGISLNHDDFERNIKKLILWLDTRHSAFTHQYVEIWREDYTSEKLLSAIKKVAGGNQIKEFLMDKFKNSLQFNSGIDVLHDILEEFTTDEVKYILENLDVEHKGTREHIIKRLHDWLNNEEVYKISSDDCDEEERMYRLADYICSSFYKFKKDSKALRDICCASGLDVGPELAAREYMSELVNSRAVFNARSLISATADDELKVKEIALYLIGSDVGRKNKLIDDIERWVNYQDE